MPNWRRASRLPPSRPTPPDFRGRRQAGCHKFERMRCHATWRSPRFSARSRGSDREDGKGQAGVPAELNGKVRPTAVRRPRSVLAGFRWLCLAATVAGLAACSTSVEGTPDAFADDQPAGNLYNEGLAYLNAGKLTDAVKSFDEVDRQHPYSEWARKALIMSAFASYRRGKYDDTISAGSRYLSLCIRAAPTRPTPSTSSASPISGRSPTSRAIRTTTKKALAAMEEIVNHYPDSEYAADAKAKADRRARPARRQGNADRPLLSRAARVPGRDQPLQASWSPTTRTPATSRRRWSGWPRPTWRWA